LQNSALSIVFGTLLDFEIFVAVFDGLSQTPWFTVDIGAFLEQFGAPFVMAIMTMQTIDVVLGYMR
jgi:hypothetical protein